MTAAGARQSSGRGRWQLGLPLPLLLALRYLRSSRRDAYVSFLSTLATGGIALGVAALVLVLAGLSGLQHFLRTDVLDRTPHVEVELAPDADSEAVTADLATVEGVLEARRLLRGRGWLLAGGGVVDVEVVGYEGELPRFFPRSDPAVLAERGFAEDGTPVAGVDGGGVDTGQAGLFLGDSLAVRWGIRAGELVDVVSARPTLTPFGPQPRLHQLRLVGTFATGATEEQQPRIAVPLDSARRLFGGRKIRIEITTADLDAALRVAERVRTRLALEPLAAEGSRVQTWQDLNRGLFFALRLEKMLMFVAVFLIVPVAAMALVTVLALLISSKRAEMGMLRAMGARPEELRHAFLALGVLLGTLGLAAGSVLGVGGAWVLDHYRLIEPPGGVYYLDHIPFLVESDDFLAVVAATALLTLLSTVWAARKAASTPPVEALRD